MAANVVKMTEGKISGLLVRFAIPMVLGKVFQLMYVFVDTAVVGQHLGVAALAALGCADFLNWFLFGIVDGITQGFAIKMSQDYGAGDENSLRKVAGNSIILTIVSSIVLVIAGLAGSMPVLQLLGTPSDIIDLSYLYIAILFIGAPVSFAYNLLSSMLRALGDSKTPLIAIVVSSIVNVILDVLFVMFFGWGIAGAAWATVIAQAVSALYCFAVVKKIPVLRITRKHMQLDPGLSLKLFKIGLPLAFQNTVIAVGGMIVQTVVNKVSVVFIASYTAVNKMYSLLDIAGTSLGYSVMTFVGQNAGAKKFDRVKAGMKTGFIMVMICSVVITVAMLVFGRNILSMFIDKKTESALEIAFSYLKLMALWLPALYVLWFVRCGIQGLGNTFIPMLSGVAEFIMRTGTALLLPLILGETGIFYAEIFAWLGADLILVPSYFVIIRSQEVL